MESILNRLKYPVFQGAMAWVSDASLAGAVSNAGGLGIVAAGNAPADHVREQIRATREITGNIFGVNIMLMSPFADDIAQLVCDESIEVVTTGAGSPAKYMDAFNSKGIMVVPVVPSVAIAKKMESLGASAIVCEGMEAGGHIGKLTTMCLVPQVADAVSIPVIAAGGIADGRGMAAAFMLGASGVQIGTRFLVAHECTIHENYKKAVMKAKDIDTVITGQITGHPVRVLRNKLAREFEKVEKEEAKKDVPDLERVESLGVGALRKAVVDGDVDFGTLMSGQIAGMVSKEQSVKEIIEEIVLECDKLMKK